MYGINRLQILRLVVGAFASGLAAAGSQAADIVWTNTSGGTWHTPANWSPNVVPTLTDNVLITTPGAYTVSITSTAAAASLSASGSAGTNTLALNSGELRVSGTMSLGNGTLFRAAGGNLIVEGSAEVNGPTEWQGTAVTGPGPLRLNGPLTAQPGFARFLTGLTVVVAGGGSGGGFALQGGTVLSNAPGSVFELSDGNGIGNFGGTDGVFLNAGTLRKTAASDPSVFVPLISSGGLEVQTGTLLLRGGGQFAGPVSVAAGAVLNFLSGTHECTAEAVLSGAGTLRTSGGVARIACPAAATLTNEVTGGTFEWVAAEDLELPALLARGGSMVLGRAVTVNGPTEWQGTAVTGPGPLRLNGPLTAQPGFARFLTGLTVVVAGGGSGGGFALQGGTVLSNAPGSVFELSDGNGIGNFGGTDGVFLNAGTLRKPGSSDISVFVPLINSGAVSVEDGVLRLRAASVQTEGLTALEGGNLAATVSFELRGGELTGSGTISGSLTNSGGIVRPGAPIGRLAVTGDFGQGAAGTLEIDLGGELAETGFDVVQVGGKAVIDGVLRASTVNGFVPSDGESFAFLGASARSGRFDAVDLSPGTPRLVVIDLGASLALLRSESTFADLALGNGTADRTQGGFHADQVLDGIFATFSNGWAPGHAAATVVWETMGDLVLPPGSTLHIRLFQDYPFTFHTIGRFRLSTNSDDRAEFADGLQNGGDVTAQWTVLTPVSVTATNVSEFTVLEDGSVLVGNATPTSLYEFRGAAPTNAITGFRLEVLEHPSLPSNGPGFAGNKNLVLTELRMTAEIPPATGLPLAISPLKTNLVVNTGARFAASGGAAPYLFDVVTNHSGGSVNPFTGAYAAGSLAGVTDTVRLTDARGSNVLATVDVVPDPTPRPDLALGLLAAPTEVLPGVPFELVYVVTNRGTAASGAPWNSAVFSSTDAVAGNDTFLAAAAIQVPLAPAASLAVTQSVVVPASGDAGPLRWVVALDTTGVIAEADEANNVMLADATTCVPHRLDLAASNPSVAEGTSALITVLRNGSRAEPLGIVLESQHPTEVAVPATVTIPAGAASTTFTAAAQADGAFDGTRVIAIHAAAVGFEPATIQITTLDANVPGLFLSLATNLLEETGTTTGTLRREGPADTPLPATLVNGGGQIAFPGTVTIPAGSASASFLVVGVPDTLVEPPVAVTLEARAAGYTPAAAALTVVDDDLPLVTLMIPAPSLSEAAGPNGLLGTITRDRVSSRPLTARLVSSNPNAAAVPGSVVIPGGQVSASFAVAAVDNGLVDGDRVVRIEGSVLTSLTGEPITPLQPVELLVTDDDGPALALVLATTLVGEGLNPAAIGTVSRNTGTLGALPVALASSNPDELTVPPSVTIPDGAASVSFPLVSIADGVNDGNRAVTLTAMAPGFSSAAAQVVVSDSDLPDLQVAGLEAPTHGLSRQGIDVSFRIENKGFAAAAGGFVQRILLSNDPLPGDDALLSQTTFSAPLPAGGFFSQTLRVNLPEKPGDYWLVVTTDATGQVGEVLEDNNRRISVSPIAVGKAYSVIVAAAAETSPANTPILLHGTATRTGSGEPAGFEVVEVHVTVRDTKRVLLAITDASGDFSTTFTPLPGEAGIYGVGADHPGVDATPVQDTFILLGMKVQPLPPLRVIEGTTATHVTVLENLTPIGLSGLTATVVAGPEAFGLEVTLGSPTVAGSGTTPVIATLTAPPSMAGSGLFRVRIDSAEGASAMLDVPFTAEALVPRLAATPSPLVAPMRRGAQTAVEFGITNSGGIATGPLTVLAPALPWLAVASGASSPALEPGAGTTVALLLTPPDDLPLGDHTGSLIVNAGNAEIAVPFTFRALSDTTGHLKIAAVDELTFYAEGSPVLTNAVVRLSDPYSGDLLLQAEFDGAPELVLTNLPEAYYDIRVEAPDHAPFANTFLLLPGRTNEVKAFLSRQTVRTTWTVEPITVEDRYTITVDTVFEANLPIPVVTAEPTVFDLADFPGETKQIDVRITNHGLLAAKGVRFDFQTHPRLQITPLIQDLGDLAAKSSLTIPVTIRKLGAAAQLASAQTHSSGDGGSDGGCTLGGKLEWSVECGGQTITTTIPFRTINLQKLPGFQCGTSAQALAAQFTPFVATGGFPPCNNPPCSIGNPGYSVPIAFKKRTVCNPCVNEILSGLTENCLPLLPIPDEIPFPDIIEDLTGESGIPINPFEREDPKCGDGAAPVEQIIACFQEALGDVKKIVKTGGEIAEILDDIGVGDAVGDFFGRDKGDAGGDGDGDDGFLGGAADAIGAGLSAVGKALDALRCLSPLFNPCIFGGGGPIGAGVAGRPVGLHDGDPSLPEPTHPLAPLAARAMAVQTHGAYFAHLLGDEIWFQGTNDTVWLDWMDAYQSRQMPESPGGSTLTPEERDELLALPLPAPVGPQEVNQLVERWNRSLAYWNAGIFNSTDVPPGENPDFLALDVHAQLYRQAHAARQAALAEGFRGVFDAYNTTRREFLDLINQDTGGGLCAQIKLRLEQQAVLSRDAFRATLEVENGLGVALEEVSVTIRVADIEGNSTTDLFQIREPERQGITALDGTGLIAAQSTGRATWVLVPAPEAAPTAPRQHFVSGTLRYRQEGVLITIPLEQAMITVLPSPRLVVQYFHQRDVHSDDPFTDEIEPAEPFSLGMLIHNEGFGVARNFRITSGQPTIVDNQKGLLVNFEIIATEVAGVGLTPSLTANFGDLLPGDRKVGRWLLKSSLQGLFIDYRAAFEHVDGLGDPRFSLLDRLEIHEMIRMVQADRALEDGLPDFLVNDVPDLNDFPDTLWFSQGSTAPVAVATDGVTDGPVSTAKLTALLTAPLGAGWSYLRVPDPADARFRLREVRRADHSPVAVNTNVWRTDCTFIGLGLRPRRENVLHLLDLHADAGTRTYTLVYELAAAADLTPPVSRVSTLASSSPLGFTVTWSGEDEPKGSGLAAFDILVSVDGTGFTNWLTGTTARGAVFLGEPGRTYAFYSRATDAAGNREEAPAAPDAQTVASQINTPPALSYPAEVIGDEGTTLTALPVASDADVPAQRLTFAAAGPVPAGLTVHPDTGLLSYPTSEGIGPATHTVRVRVTDSGFPSLSATNSVTLVVREINQPPVLAPLSDVAVSEGASLVLVVSAADPDLPANRITYALAPGAPAGASITTGDGIFSWRPDATAGPSTNWITVVATDNGTPPLSATSSFNVVVRDTAADFVVSVGSTNVFGGELGAVPLRLRTGLPLTELTFDLTFDRTTLTGLSLQELAPEVLGHTVTTLDDNTVTLRLVLDGAAPVTADRTLGWLEFQAAPDQPSSLTLIQPQTAAALGVSGYILANAQLESGRVVVVNAEPVLTLDGQADPVLTLYGRPGRSYTVESTTQIAPEASWLPITHVLLDGRFIQLPISPAQWHEFFRARE
ncbi:MAG TPA: CARDB domain-containing protein [Verrucomicrobiota bacterium]|nr:CARDB domain-containing protein [Verrucomicrobiota bacterium]HNU49455.1 CARDB domain-containing protein [Verrucomicrobiota bacterium]